MLGDFPVKVDIRKDRLAPAGHGLLREFKDHHLGQLLHGSIVQPHQIWCEEEIDRVPADGACKIALQGCGKLDHVGKQDLGMFGRLCHGQGIGQIKAESFQILQGLS